MAAYRAVLEPIKPESGLARWFAWLDARALKIDPLRRIDRDRVLTLYHATYDAERVLEEGFRDPEITSWGREEPPGVFLADRQADAGYGTHLVEVCVPERVVLPYEWAQEGSGLRKFYVPAEILNRSARLSPEA